MKFTKLSNNQWYAKEHGHFYHITQLVNWHIVSLTNLQGDVLEQSMVKNFTLAKQRANEYANKIKGIRES